MTTIKETHTVNTSKYKYPDKFDIAKYIAENNCPVESIIEITDENLGTKKWKIICAKPLTITTDLTKQVIK